MTPVSKVKKKKKNISLGIIHIRADFNNTIVTITDTQGNVVGGKTAGQLGFTGGKKATPYAAQMTVDAASEEAKNDNGMKTVSIRVRGPGSQREAAMRAALSQNFVVTTMTDVSPIAHNGVKPPKRRRN